jgi:tRNA threonylcarbamoyladenosine biosynthesis protein TsaB
MILCIETATSVCSVALCDRDSVVSLKESHNNKSHASQLTVFIIDLLKEQGIKTSGLEAVAVSKGPGSYTGLRIGISAAKGICYSSDIPLIGIDTTRSIFEGTRELAERKRENIPGTLFVPMIDARRMEVFYCVYDSNGEKIREINAGIVDDNFLGDLPDDKKIIISGDGALKASQILRRDNILFYDEIIISAENMRFPAYDALKAKRFEDIAYFEPFYLKDFIATIPKNKIF